MKDFITARDYENSGGRKFNVVSLQDGEDKGCIELNQFVFGANPRYILKLIICYISSGATNIAEVSSWFHHGQLHGHCLLLSNQFFVLVYLFTCLSELHSNIKRADENVSSI